ncbi:MAG: type IX secretion system membrane protein PorP/SprF [Bacteroidia bacterium]|nr:type IX secretion system membrane protein PorP/SprF [Bacteroidia bacterium]NND26210.1 type IX secretion system membrane protein PorP/SprF [Flavobacteriaceae bacterium]MBT8278412.1 type IX secretion system membrane protein PorP/SprF [Bacteroidia bacterium]NNK61163.1 type IX secretion system membrane protein PorP/SprF [Flavobacteriaceae bacterium]NNL32884.1 type IX secretion system membrane protein PorP/SprF [Flavobacteriaceae bacterium]
MKNHDKIIRKTSFIQSLLTFVVYLMVCQIFAQQDPQYTQYMYNTMSVNPAYAGQRDVLSITGLHRSQWVGIEGAPQTQTLGIHAPLRNERIGLGLNVINDALGPAQETYVNVNFSYTIPLNELDKKLSFGLTGGLHLLDTDWSKGQFQNPDVVFNENLSLISPTVGAGLYLHSRKWYLGLSVPNIITTEHYNDFQESLATERLHFFLIGGYVFNLSDNTKLKPAFLVKAVTGAPIIADVSANFLFYEKLTLGLAWRWDDALSGLAGFQISEGLYVGYAYDYTTTDLKNYNSGTHEIVLRFELQKLGRILSPRFF